jgi:hypothetical protein
MTMFLLGLLIAYVVRVLVHALIAVVENSPAGWIYWHRLYYIPRYVRFVVHHVSLMYRSKDGAR